MRNVRRREIKSEADSASSSASAASKSFASASSCAALAGKCVDACSSVIVEAKIATPSGTDFKLALDAESRAKAALHTAKQAARQTKAACDAASEAAKRARAATNIKKAKQAAVEAMRAAEEAHKANMSAQKAIQQIKFAGSEGLNHVFWKIFSCNKRIKRDLDRIWRMFKGEQ